MKDFLKQYIVWILLGVCIALLLVLVVLSVYRNTKEQKTEIEKIQNPYFVQTENLEIDLKRLTIDIPEKEKTYKVGGNNKEVFLSFLNSFYRYNEEVDFSKEVYLTFEKDILSYSPKSRILMVSSDKGLVLRLNIISQEDIEIFFNEYFDIGDVNITKVTSLNSGYEYRGKFIIKKIQFGSIFLEGDAFVLQVDDKGNLTNLSVLLINENNIKDSQTMPLVDISYLLSNAKYPKMVRHLEVEERYYESSPLAAAVVTLKEFYTDKVSKSYVFNDSENGYILPTYKLEGDGRLISPRGDKYWAKTNIFICAINPLFLYERVLPEGEEFSLPVSPDGI